MTDDVTTHEVISAFLDDEPFDAAELRAALADPAGRELLTDLVALRHTVQPDQSSAVVMRGPVGARPGIAWWTAAAAALAIAVFGGYRAGQRRESALPSRATATSMTTAPEPTTVFRFQPGVNWVERGKGN